MDSAGRLFSLGFVISLTTLAACGVGDDGELPSTPEPRICSATLAITGTFTIGAMVPDRVNNNNNEPPGDGMPDFTGCWPTGTWTWTMTVGESNCATAPAPEASYSFRTDYLPDANGEPQYSYTLLAPQLTDNYRLKVSSGGGLCEGILEIYANEGKESWLLHPALDVFNQSGPLTGEGEYAMWKESQYP
ncbi:MAG: hypothetical protein SFX73_06070 [Kofleriaceae bacterium]|nr:hypothetical protein [Kofleriaceae bacterium]